MLRVLPSTVHTFYSCTSRSDVSMFLVAKTPASMTPVTCESKLHVRLVVRSSMHPCPGNWAGIDRVVVYYIWAAQAFSAGTECWHCISWRLCALSASMTGLHFWQNRIFTSISTAWVMRATRYRAGTDKRFKIQNSKFHYANWKGQKADHLNIRNTW